MQRLWIIGLAFLLAGCTDDADDEPEAPETPVEFTPEFLTFSDAGTILLGTQGADSCGATGAVDTASHTWTIPAESNGTEVKGKDLEIEMGMGLTGIDLDLFVYGPDGSEIASGTSFNLLDGTTTESVLIPAAPAGDYRVDVVGCLAVAASYTLEGSVTLVAA